MPSLVTGADGLLSGSGSVIADLHVKLWNAIQKKDLATAQFLNDRIWPFAQVIYQPPFCDAHSRLKEALVLLGRQKNAYIRPPLLSCERDVPKLREALIAAGLLK
jgi:4-hydroxy-tetrahydrodipicolinate synthase